MSFFLHYESREHKIIQENIETLLEISKKYISVFHSNETDIHN